MNTEQERAAFEAWMRDNHPGHRLIFVNGYLHRWPQRLWEAYQAGRAALQSQDAEDAERYRWIRDEAGLMVLPYDDHGLGPEFPCGSDLDAAIDHARRIEGEGK